MQCKVLHTKNTLLLLVLLFMLGFYYQMCSNHGRIFFKESACLLV